MINQPRALDEIEIEEDVGIPLSDNRSATEEISDKMDNTAEGIPPPNGGLRAWTVVAASFFIQTFTFTSEFMFGVFEHNYLMIYPDVGPSKISLIGIIASCTTYLTGFLSGSLSDRYGYRQTASIGALIMTVSLVLASFSTQLWHLYVTQGLMMGFGASLAYYAAVGAPAHWFTSRRGIAMGISSAGAGVGGFYLAPLTQFLVTKTGLPWTLRALALYCLCACGIASLLLAEYKQPQITSKQKGQIATCKDEGLAASRTSMAFKLLPIVRKPIFQVLVASQFLLAMAYLTPAYYLEVYATHIGLSEQMGASIIGWFNGATVVSRVVTGIVADRISKGGLLIVSSWMTCISVLVIWPLATSPGPFIAYALIYGVSFGAVTTVVPVMMVDYYGPERVSTIIGIVFSCCSVALLCGVQISGYLLERTKPMVHFLPLAIFSGTMFGLSAIMTTLWVYLLKRREGRIAIKHCM